MERFIVANTITGNKKISVSHVPVCLVEKEFMSPLHQNAQAFLKEILYRELTVSTL
jgi:hypothetical protein